MEQWHYWAYKHGTMEQWYYQACKYGGRDKSRITTCSMQSRSPRTAPHPPVCLSYVYCVFYRYIHVRICSEGPSCTWFSTHLTASHAKTFRPILLLLSCHKSFMLGLLISIRRSKLSCGRSEQALISCPAQILQETSCFAYGLPSCRSLVHPLTCVS